MSRWNMPKERGAAQSKVNAAVAALAAVCALPTEVGARVRWTSGVVWIRAADDEWTSDSHWEARANGITHPSYSSAHVASMSWVAVSASDDSGVAHG